MTRSESRSNPGQPLLTAADLAERWQVKPSQIYRLSRDGRIPTVRVGRYFRYSLEQIERFEAGADR